MPVTFSFFAPTMRTMNRDGDQETFRLSPDFSSYPTTTVSF
jgi:hypothetical protein